MRTRITRAQWAIILLISGLVSSGAVAWRYRHIPHFGRFDDDAVYVVCAKALAEGHGYRIDSLPGQPAETKFPPLFPALVSVVWRLDSRFPSNLTWLTPWLWAAIPMLCVVSLPVFRLVGFDLASSLTLAGLIALNPVTAIFGVSVMPELLFTLLCFGSLALVEKAPGRWCTAAIAGVLGALAYLDRTAALPLLFTVPVCLLARRRWAAAVAYVGGMSPAVAGWAWWCRDHRVRTSDPTLLFHTDYFGQYISNLDWRDLPETVSTNLAGLISSAGRLLLFHSDSTAAGLYGTYVAGAIVTVAAIILLWNSRHATPQFGAFAAAYCAILLVWNYPPNQRFVLPLLPFALAGVAAAVRPFAMPARAAILALAVGVNGYTLFHSVPQILDADAARMAQANGAAAWIERNTPGGSRFYAYDDALFYLRTGRQAIAPHLLNKSSHLDDRRPIVEFFRAIPDWSRARGLNYAFVTPGDFSRDLTDLESREVLDSMARLPRVHSSPGSMVLKFQLP